MNANNDANETIKSTKDVMNKFNSQISLEDLKFVNLKAKVLSIVMMEQRLNMEKMQEKKYTLMKTKTITQT